MKSAGKARNNGLYRHIRTSKEIIRNLLNDSDKKQHFFDRKRPRTVLGSGALVHPSAIHAARQHALCFCRRLRQSAIMAMNSEFVGLPLMFETV